jgi:hypothetical protein
MRPQRREAFEGVTAMKRNTRWMDLGAVLLASLVLALSPSVASADGRWGGRYDRGDRYSRSSHSGWNVSVGVGFGGGYRHSNYGSSIRFNYSDRGPIYRSERYYAPRYYAPRVVYRSAPVYVAPPVRYYPSYRTYECAPRVYYSAPVVVSPRYDCGYPRSSYYSSVRYYYGR